MNNNNRLKEVRKDEWGMPIAELSRRSKVSRYTIHKLESGKCNPTVNTVTAICKVLKKNPDDIFFNLSVINKE